MKNYYYDPKSRELMIFDTESNEILRLEVISGIHVITSSEIKHPTNFHESDVARERGGGGERRGKRHCKKCGEAGHRSDNCPN